MSPVVTAARQPWLHDLVVAVHGPATALSERDGTMGAPGTGLFVADRRVLSRFAVTLGGEAIVPVACGAAGWQAQFLGSARNLGGPDGLGEVVDPVVELRRTRTVTPDGMVEHLEVISRAAVPVRADLVVRVAGDGAPIASVKSGRSDHPVLLAQVAAPGAEGGSVGWQDDRLRTRVGCEPAPDRIHRDGDDVALTFPVDLPAHGSWRLTLTVTTQPAAPTSFDAGAGSTVLTFDQVQVEAVDTRLDHLARVSLQDLQGLLLTDPQAPQDAFCAAGTPWYLTLFGRDSLWCARFMLPFGTELAAGTLRALARRQGTDWDAASVQEPGRIPHEVRRALPGEQVAFDDPTAGLQLPAVYYGSVDATALWLCLWAEAFQHGMPVEQVRDLLPAARAAFGYLQRATGEAGDGLLRYRDTTGHGLANQGWKDSADAMRRADGTIAPAPIALVEAQAYAAEAAQLGAGVLRALGEPGTGDWEKLAETMRARIRQHFWVGHEPYPAMAIDGGGRPVDGIGSNMGHLLGTGILTDDEAARVVDTLTGPDMLGRFGISTLSRSNPAYNPLGYHTGSVWTHDTAICALGMARQGFTGQAADVSRALVAAGSWYGGRWPELFAGDGVLGAPAPYPAACRPQGWAAASIGAVVTIALGLQIDVPGRRVRMRPASPPPFGAMTVRGLAFGSIRFTAQVHPDGTVTVTGLPADVALDLPNG